MSEKWLDEFEIEYSDIDGRKVYHVFPPNGTENGRWMLKTEYFGAFPALEKHMLRRGYHLFHIVNSNRYGTPDNTAAQGRLAEYVHAKLGLSEKCIPVGMSCGGMEALYFAAEYPQYVSALYLDAPVVNFLSWPFGLGSGRGSEGAANEFLSAWNMNRAELLSFRNHPFDILPKIIESKIPAVLVYGDEDNEVPFEENGRFIVKAYENTGIDFAAFGKEHCGHHPHGLEDSSQVINFLLKHDK